MSEKRAVDGGTGKRRRWHEQGGQRGHRRTKQNRTTQELMKMKMTKAAARVSTGTHQRQRVLHRQDALREDGCVTKHVLPWHPLDAYHCQGNFKGFTMRLVSGLWDLLRRSYTPLYTNTLYGAEPPVRPLGDGTDGSCV